MESTNIENHLEGETPYSGETPSEFCIRMASDKIDPEDIKKCLYYRGLINYSEEQSLLWTDKATQIFVDGSVGIIDIKERR